MTINSPAAIIWAMYIAAAEKQGVPPSQLGGTIQNDILKEYIAQKEFIFPPAPSMRLVTDTIEFGIEAPAPVEHDQHQRLPHPRGRHRRRRRNWPSRWPMGSSTSAGRSSAGWTWTTSRRGCQLLLQCPQRLLRGDRQVPRGAAHLGARDARNVRRQESAFVVDALPHADRRASR